MTTSASARPEALTPFDTGVRLEPRLWPVDGDVDRYGRVDFDDDESATVLTAYAEHFADGSHALHVELNTGGESTAVFVDGMRYAPAVPPFTDDQG